jgi:hypothetical protein
LTRRVGIAVDDTIHLLVFQRVMSDCAVIDRAIRSKK